MSSSYTPSNTSLKPLKIWAHGFGPNPFKVRIVMEELGLPYEKEIIEFPDMKKEAYESLNPNGRVPTLIDPNTGITIWESGAIIQYLIETYDKEHKLSSTSPADKWAETQWLHYQMSGQGPYWGQYVWFARFHKEQLPSAVERYANEIRRVVYVLDSALKDKEYLVGNRCTYADLSFTVWNWVIQMAGKEMFEDLERQYPRWKAWNDRLEAREIVGRLHAERVENAKLGAQRAQEIQRKAQQEAEEQKKAQS